MVSVGLLAWIVWTRGLDIGVALQRRALQAIGFDRIEIMTPIGEQTVFVEPASPGEDRTLVMIHGFGDQAATWLGVAGELETDHRLVVVDLAGHGDSDPQVGMLSFDELYAAFESVLAATVTGKPAAFLGNSLGGWVALRYALDHPERVEQLLLLNAAGLEQPLDEDLLIPEDREDLAEKLRRMFPEGSIPKLPGFIQDQLIESTSAQHFRSLFRSTTDASLDLRLADLDVPTHLLWGTPDGFFPLDYARRLQDAVAGATLAELPGCGHAPQVVCASALAERVRLLLSGSPE